MQRHKPQRVFLSHRFIGYLRFKDKTGPAHNYPSCKEKFDRIDDHNYQDRMKILVTFSEMVKKIKSFGSEVYVTAMHPEDHYADPHTWIGLFSFASNNIKPIILS